LLVNNGEASNYLKRHFFEKNFFSNLSTSLSLVFQKTLLSLKEKFVYKVENKKIHEFEQHKVRLLNKLIFTISILALISGILISVFESIEHGLISFLFIPILLLAFFFIRIGKTKLAFAYFVFSDFIVQTLLIFIASPNFGLSYYYLIVPFMVCIFFEERPVLRTFTILLSLFLFVAAQFAHFFYQPILMNNHVILFTISTFTVYFVISYYLVRFYLVELKTYRQKIINIFDELNTKNDSLENFNRVAAHDLKEPLNSIIGFATLVEARLAKSETKKDLEIESLLHIKDASKRMKQLLNDLMAYSVSERSVKDFEAVDLNEILTDVQKNLYSAIEQSKAEVNFKDLPVIEGNRNFISQLFQNLIANAIKFQPKNVNDQDLHTPLIEIESATNEKEVVTYIKDNGIGIPKDKLQIIFEPFKRLNLRSKYAGSGLGLATCKNIVNQFGGDIKVESELGNGTTFILSFPKR